MPRRLLAAVAVSASLAGCFAGPAGRAGAPGDLRVRRGDFRGEIVLSGEVEAA